MGPLTKGPDVTSITHTASTATRLALLAAVSILASYGGSRAPALPALSSGDVVAAFQAAGLPAEDPKPIPPNEFGIAPVLTDDATRFLIPSLGQDSGGRAFVLVPINGSLPEAEAKKYGDVVAVL